MLQAKYRNRIPWKRVKASFFPRHSVRDLQDMWYAFLRPSPDEQNRLTESLFNLTPSNFSSIKFLHDEDFQVESIKSEPFRPRQKRIYNIPDRKPALPQLPTGRGVLKDSTNVVETSKKLKNKGSDDSDASFVDEEESLKNRATATTCPPPSSVVAPLATSTTVAASGAGPQCQGVVAHRQIISLLSSDDEDEENVVG